MSLNNRGVFSHIAIITCALIVSFLVGAGTFISFEKEVEFKVNEEIYSVKTMENTVGEAIEHTPIDLIPEDYINVGLDQELSSKDVNKVVIKKAVPINILVDGKEIKGYSWKKTVREAIDLNNIKISQKDRLNNASFSDAIYPGMNIEIIRVEEKIVKEEEEIAYSVVTKDNNYLDKGIRRIIREGKDGQKEKKFKVVLENGIETAKELLDEYIISEPVDKIVELGTVMTYNTARGGPIRYTQVLDVAATSYTANFECTGKNPGHPQFGITRSGTRARRGVIAVDPRVIPLGTKVYVEIAGNIPDYGFAVAEDTGGAIKGNIIDLYFEDEETVYQWGKKRAKVYILAN